MSNHSSLVYKYLDMPEEQEKKKAIVLFSGGLDSTTLVYEYIARGFEVEALSVYYGQRHSRELEAARLIAAQLQIKHHYIDLSAASIVFNRSVLTDERRPVPEGHYQAASMAATVVPNRNAILLSLAWGLAVTLQAQRVGYAAHSGDHFIYPDCRSEFVGAMAEALYLGNTGYQDPTLILDAPFLRMTKGMIVTRGFALGVPFNLTWSCYNGGELHCGKCGTCVERKEAFEFAGVPDPTQYFQG